MGACSTTARVAHVAAEVIAGEQQGNKEQAASAFNARVIPSVAYPDPEVAWVGITEDQAKARTCSTVCDEISYGLQPDWYLKNGSKRSIFPVFGRSFSAQGLPSAAKRWI